MSLCYDHGCLIFGEGISATLINQVTYPNRGPCDYLIEAPHAAASRPYWSATNYCCAEDTIDPPVRAENIVVGGGLCAAWDHISSTLSMYTNHRIGFTQMITDPSDGDVYPPAYQDIIDEIPVDDRTGQVFGCTDFKCITFGSGLNVTSLGDCDYLVEATGGGGGGCEDGVTETFTVVKDIECDGDGFEVTYTTMQFVDGCLQSVVHS